MRFAKLLASSSTILGLKQKAYNEKQSSKFYKSSNVRFYFIILTYCLAIRLCIKSGEKSLLDSNKVIE